MGSAFTPGLAISANATIRKTRRLPIKGEVIVNKGDLVNADTIVAKVDLPGTLAVVKAAPLLGCSPEQLRDFCFVNENECVGKDKIIAERKVFFGLVTNKAKAPLDGTIEYISHLSGNIGIRGKPKPLFCNAYISGTVVEVIENEGVVIETKGALVQGIFGVGGEKHAGIIWVNSSNDSLTAEDLSEAHRNKIIVFPGRIDSSVLYAAKDFEIKGIVGASIIDSELMSFLGYDIGVAVTGEEKIPFSLIITEGFGSLKMPGRTVNLLKSLNGKYAAINGATQIRAGVIRPELIVPQNDQKEKAEKMNHELKIGTRVRLIRRPNFGKIGTVSKLHDQPVVIETGSKVRVLSIEIENGNEVTVPRANVEIISNLPNSVD